MRILFLFFLIGCGDHEGRRCLTREEALMKCESSYLHKYDLQTAKMLCEPLYQVERCYEP
jgi:hypothetical protein